MDPIFSIIGCLLYSDLKKYSYALLSLVRNNSFLAIDDAGSIGQARTRVILVRRWIFSMWSISLRTTKALGNSWMGESDVAGCAHSLF